MNNFNELKRYQVYGEGFTYIREDSNGYYVKAGDAEKGESAIQMLQEIHEFLCKSSLNDVHLSSKWHHKIIKLLGE